MRVQRWAEHTRAAEVEWPVALLVRAMRFLLGRAEVVMWEAEAEAAAAEEAAEEAAAAHHHHHH